MLARYLFWQDSTILIFNKMKKSILRIEGVNQLSKERLKMLLGGYKTWCRRRSDNFEDVRRGYVNENGCWIYPGMPWNAHPNCPPNPNNPIIGGC